MKTLYNAIILAGTMFLASCSAPKDIRCSFIGGNDGKDTVEYSVDYRQNIQNFQYEDYVQILIRKTNVDIYARKDWVRGELVRVVIYDKQGHELERLEDRKEGLEAISKLTGMYKKDIDNALRKLRETASDSLTTELKRQQQQAKQEYKKHIDSLLYQ